MVYALVMMKENKIGNWWTKKANSWAESRHKLSLFSQLQENSSEDFCNHLRMDTVTYAFVYDVTEYL